jgi:hypothetical protein
VAVMCHPIQQRTLAETPFIVIPAKAEISF